MPNVSALTGRSYRRVFAVGLCLSASGCSFQHASIDGQETDLLSNDHAEVTRDQKSYDASVVENGLYSGETRTAATDLDDTRRKLVIDQRQFDDYLSASGQSSDPRQ